MCCASTVRVTEIQEAVKYQYGGVVIDTSVFMDDIAAVETAYNIRKGIVEEWRLIYGLTENDIWKII